MKKDWKRWGSLVFLCTLLFFCGCQGKESGEGFLEEQNAPGLTVTFFNVGKGDAILIEAEEERMLIDSGYDDTSGEILGYLEEQGIRRLDYLVITHFDKDHVGGADHVLEAVEVGEILQPDYVSESGQYLEYREALEQAGKEPVLVTETWTLSLGNAELVVYPPQQEEYKEEDNDFSLVISMAYGERRFVFAGDSERERLKELLSQSEFELAHDLLKVPHHGRDEKNSREFLEAVCPEFAVITCSEDKPAEPEILKILDGMGTKTYQTWEGTVICQSDGTFLEMRTE